MERLSSYAFREYGGDAMLYNGIHDLEQERDRLLELLKITCQKCNGSGFSKPGSGYDAVCDCTAGYIGTSGDRIVLDIEVYRRQEECISELTKFAHSRGWNGVENSKILHVFTRNLIEGLEEERDQLAAALDSLRDIALQVYTDWQQPEGYEPLNAEGRKLLYTELLNRCGDSPAKILHERDKRRDAHKRLISRAEQMSERQIGLARHALGLPNEENRSYRNYYHAPKESDNHDQWLGLVRKGLARTEGDRFFLTRRAAKLVLEKGERLDPEFSDVWPN